MYLVCIKCWHGAMCVISLSCYMDMGGGGVMKLGLGVVALLHSWCKLRVFVCCPTEAWENLVWDGQGKKTVCVGIYIYEDATPLFQGGMPWGDVLIHDQP